MGRARSPGWHRLFEIAYRSDVSRCIWRDPVPDGHGNRTRIPWITSIAHWPDWSERKLRSAGFRGRPVLFGAYWNFWLKPDHHDSLRWRSGDRALRPQLP